MNAGEVAELLGADGALAHQLEGFVPRRPQQDMAAAVAQAVDAGTTLVVEAGTGTGKTYAYLVPALMSGQRVAISTGTKNLQDQLFHRDLPRIRDALAVPARVALLKGRANYLCLYRMKRAATLPGLGLEPRRLRDIEEWSRSTPTGELSEMGQFADADPLQRQVTSTADNCLGSKCPDFSACFVAKARRNAQAADVVVINHHLLFADYLLKEEGFGQILSGVDVCIIDEAHQLPELAAAFFGVRLSTRQLHELCKDAQTETESLADIAHVSDCVAELATRATTLESAFAAMPNRVTLRDFLNNSRVSDAVVAARDALSALYEAIKPYEERSAEMASCVARADALVERLQTILDEDDHERVRWVEALGRGGSLHATPIQVAEGFRKMAAAYPGAWIFTSATLAANDDFSHFSGQMGLDGARELKLDSPFDFAAQARLYLPKGMPEPSDQNYSDAVADAALPLIEASGGGAFILCTSHRALRRIAERLRGSLKMKLFVQGDDNRAALLQAFADHGDAVLVGTSSFWEGVDVKGRALRLVIIDKLPFTAPGDPVFEAKLAAIRAGGGNPFNDFQVPQAITALRQGVGRLIRDAGDRGLLALFDPRLRSKSYGKRMLASLPQMPVLTELADAQQWLRSL